MATLGGNNKIAVTIQLKYFCINFQRLQKAAWVAAKAWKACGRKAHGGGGGGENRPHCQPSPVSESETNNQTATHIGVGSEWLNDNCICSLVRPIPSFPFYIYFFFRLIPLTSLCGAKFTQNGNKVNKVGKALGSAEVSCKQLTLNWQQTAPARFHLRTFFNGSPADWRKVTKTVRDISV